MEPPLFLGQSSKWATRRSKARQAQGYLVKSASRPMSSSAPTRPHVLPHRVKVSRSHLRVNRQAELATPANGEAHSNCFRSCPPQSRPRCATRRERCSDAVLKPARAETPSPYPPDHIIWVVPHWRIVLISGGSSYSADCRLVLDHCRCNDYATARFKWRRCDRIKARC